MKYKAVIFDLDGTLLDTIDDIADSFNETLKKYHHQTFSINEYKYFVGRGIDELIRKIIKKANLSDFEFDNLKNGYIEEYALRHNAKTKLYPGIIELVNKLKENGVLVSVLSNKPHFQTVDVIAYYFNDFEFDLVYGKKPEFEIKPNPESARDLINKLDLKPEEVLYVGDTNTDMETAINANLTSVGVAWGFRTKAELKASGADYIVSSPLDIYKIVVGDGNDFKSR